MSLTPQPLVSAVLVIDSAWSSVAFVVFEPETHVGKPRVAVKQFLVLTEEHFCQWSHYVSDLQLIISVGGQDLTVESACFGPCSRVSALYRVPRWTLLCPHRLVTLCFVVVVWQRCRPRS